MQDALPVDADSGQIEQILINLATNARDAMPGGGLLSIETGMVEVDSEFIRVHGYGNPGWYATISVSDTGEGMDETTCKKVFEPFFTTKEPGKGTGLGLSVVFGIVKQHSGFINVYSEPGTGTTFRILLPLVQSALAEILASEEFILERGVETILVADDDASLRDLAVKALDMFGYTVITAKNGSDALTRFNENKNKIDLVIMDIIMPGKNGKETFDEMRKLNPSVKAIFISGYTSDILLKKGLIEPDLELVTKPLHIKQLLLKVRKVLDRKV
jgi:CheY-like chemotaxis protein